MLKKTPLILFIFVTVFVFNLKAEPYDFKKDTNYINQLISNINPNVIKWRRHIHQNPELGFNEYQTSKYIISILKPMGYKIYKGYAKTGFIAVLEGSSTKTLVAYRAELDALPIEEKTDIAFKSTKKSLYKGKPTFVAHLCGHDAHMAIAMGTAEVFSQLQKKGKLKDSVIFIFQPAEEGSSLTEKLPYSSGAKYMLKEGVFSKYKPDALFALHSMPFEAGKIFYSTGAFYASSNNFDVVISGKGGHGGLPWGTIDPIVITAEIIENIQTIVSRNTDLTKGAAVVSIGYINGGVKNNVIPTEVKFGGTIRSVNEENLNNIINIMETRIPSLAKSLGAKAVVSIDKNNAKPVGVNNKELAENTVAIFEEVLGKESVEEVAPTTVTEDFSYYTKVIKNTFYFGLGTAKKGLKKGEDTHSSYYYINEDSLIVGVKAFVYAGLNYMNNNSKAF